MIDDEELIRRVSEIKELARIPPLSADTKYTYVIRYTELLKIIREVKEVENADRV